MTRKIIQIVTIPEGETTFPCIFALCDDGIVYGSGRTRDNTWGKWVRAPDIPQDSTLDETSAPSADNKKV